MTRPARPPPPARRPSGPRPPFLPAVFPGTSARAVAGKVVTNQLLITLPIFAAFVGFTVSIERSLRAVVAGDGGTVAEAMDEIKTRLEVDVVQVFKKSCVL